MVVDSKEEKRLALLERSIAAQIVLIGGSEVDPEAIQNTPGRVARAMMELYSGYECSPEDILSRTFTSVSDEMIVVKDIPLYSMCEHHLLPFIGIAHVGYIPDGKILGISKIARLVECFSRRMQIQERLTTQVADALMNHLGPRGVGVIIEAEHTCMTMRGVNKPGTRTVTSAMRGLFKEDPKTRAEFLRLIELRGA
jgi:GTP cyclohydrolase IA